MAKSLCVNPRWEGRADCKHCPIREQVLFAKVPDEELDHVLQPIDNLSFTPKSDIYERGDSAEAVYTIRRGVVKLTRPLANGARRVVRLLHVGDAIGLEALIEPEYRHTASVVNGANLCRIPVSVVEQLLARYDVLRNEVLRRWQRNLDQADRFISELSTGPSQTRMARLLLMDEGHTDSVCSTAFSREDLGEMLGITTETASRIIAEFKRQGLLEETQGCFYLPDRKALEKLAE